MEFNILKKREDDIKTYIMMIYESKLNQMDHYLSQLQFKEGISDYFNCNIDKNVGSEENKKFKQTQEDNLKKSYTNKNVEKKNNLSKFK